MDIEVERSLRALESGIGLLPGALIAITLLGGPTLAWLLYRFVVQPRTSRYRASQVGALWICSFCRSANDLESSRCYRCHEEFEDGQIELIDPTSGGMVTARLPEFEPAPPQPDHAAEPHWDIAAIGGRAPVAVGPGKPDRAPAGATRTKRPVTATADRPAKPKAERPVTAKAERPAKPKVDRPRRAVAAGRAAPKRTEPSGRAEG